MIATRFAAETLRLLPRKRLSRAIGRVARADTKGALLSRAIDLYVRAYDVDLSECEVPAGGYRSFNEFFTRPLREGARPLDADPTAVLSPADGKIEDAGAIDDRGSFRIKGRPYSLDELLGSKHEAARLAGGLFVVVYLSPRDYHRVHSPVEGRISLVRSMPGDYFPVNSIGLRHIDNLFAINRRVAICIDTETLGRVTVVMVAAIVVGRITVSGIDAHDVPLGVHTIAPARNVQRGDELGQFHLGSTAVVFLEPKAFDRWLAQEGPVRVGQEIAAPKGGTR